ncbi:MAG: hypothetical protein J6U92_07210 [Clostridia bacterium]|nr:hypothetical protein [Clostridia bacterium]
MLSKIENKVMHAVYGVCYEKATQLISPVDLIRLSGVVGLTQSKLERVMEDLSSDGYFDLIYSDRRGERIYCVTLTDKGKGYNREKRAQQRYILMRLCLTVGLAILSFIIGLILKAIF